MGPSLGEVTWELETKMWVLGSEFLSCEIKKIKGSNIYWEKLILGKVRLGLGAASPELPFLSRSGAVSCPS